MKEYRIGKLIRPYSKIEFMPFLSICIPTYQRKDYLLKNLENLKEILITNNLQWEVSVLIADNSSQDGTLEAISEYIAKNPEIKIDFYSQKENKGYSYNFNSLIASCNSEYLLICGDDDYLSELYVLSVLEEIKRNSRLTVVFPAFQTIEENGKKLKGNGRDLNCKKRYYKSGVKSLICNSFRAHQLSGLLFKTTAIKEGINPFEISNLYPQLYYASIACLKGEALHLPDFPVLVTQTERKYWSYDNIGLLSDIFDNYRRLPLSSWSRYKAERKMIYRQSWRLLRFPLLPQKQFEIIKELCNGPNTSSIGRKLLPLDIFYLWSIELFKFFFIKRNA